MTNEEWAVVRKEYVTWEKLGIFLSGSMLGTRKCTKEICIQRQSSGKYGITFPPCHSSCRRSNYGACAALPKPFRMRTSARRTTRLPSGQMTWSTWERTRSHVSSGVRRLVWKEDSTVDCGSNGRKGKKALRSMNERNHTTSISVLEWPILHTIQLFFMRSKCSRVTTFLFPKNKGRAAEGDVEQQRYQPAFSRRWERGVLLHERACILCEKSVCCITALQAHWFGFKIQLYKKPSGKKSLCSGKHWGSDRLR